MAAMSTMGLVAAGVAAAGSVGGALISKSGAEAAGGAAAAGADRASQVQLMMAREAAARNDAEATRGRNAVSPWASAGRGAVDKIGQLLGLGSMVGDNTEYSFTGDPNGVVQRNALNAFQTSPGYEWRKQEGINALDRSGAAKGLLLSGKQIKGVQNYGDGLASDEWRNYMADLQGVSGQGLNATTSANSTAASLIGGGSNALAAGGNAAGNTLFQGEAARASAYSKGADALASGIGSATNNLMMGAYLFGGKGGGARASGSGTTY